MTEKGKVAVTVGRAIVVIPKMIHGATEDEVERVAGHQVEVGT